MSSESSDDLRSHPTEEPGDGRIRGQFSSDCSDTRGRFSSNCSADLGAEAADVRRLVRLFDRAASAKGTVLGVDPKSKERLLSHEEFQAEFGMTLGLSWKQASWNRSRSSF